MLWNDEKWFFFEKGRSGIPIKAFSIVIITEKKMWKEGIPLDINNYRKNFLTLPHLFHEKKREEKQTWYAEFSPIFLCM